MPNPLIPMGDRAKQSAQILAVALSAQKDAALAQIAKLLVNETDAILSANRLDLAAAKENGISEAMQDRLLLTPERIVAIADSIDQIIAIADPIGQILEGQTRPNGIEISKKTVPLGVVGIIFESRPNVTIDCAVLCLKSGNACILRGGKEALHSNMALAAVVRRALGDTGLPEDCVQLIDDPTRESSTALMQLTGYIDVLIPRGGKGLIRSVIDNATVPTIETGAGVCHLYLDEYANLEMGLSILVNAKVSRPSVCNAVETLLVHQAVAAEFLPMAAKALDNVELRGCERSLPLLGTKAIPATEEDWREEYDDYILAVRVVDSLDQALEHMDHYSTKHSEIIITDNYQRAEYFASHVDAAAIYLNASSRFTDGGEFGKGAEIGISTQKLHARGPMGLEALTSYKYIVRGYGQIR